MTKKHLEISSQ